MADYYGAVPDGALNDRWMHQRLPLRLLRHRPVQRNRSVVSQSIDHRNQRFLVAIRKRRCAQCQVSMVVMMSQMNHRDRLVGANSIGKPGRTSKRCANIPETERR